MTTFSRRHLIIYGLACSLILISGRYSCAQSDLKIEGEVMGQDDTSIPSVLVQAFREATMIGESKTDSDGKYSIGFDKGSPISTVRYERTGYYPGVIEDISGIRNQRISKTLYQLGSELSTFAAQQTLSALERVYYVDIANKVEVGQLKEKYAPTIEKLSVPKEFESRLKVIRTLYGMD